MNSSCLNNLLDVCGLEQSRTQEKLWPLLGERTWNGVGEIPATAVKIGELLSTSEFDGHYNARLPKKQAECWHVAFSPNETIFAWLCGNRKVVLRPWNHQKNCLLSADNTDNEGRECSAHVVTLECKYPVFCVAFGSGIPAKNFANQTGNRWKLFDFSQDMILATGHLNGTIRIWDVYTGRLLLQLMDHRDAVRDLSFAPDGSMQLVSASLDRTLKVWDLKDDGNMFKTLQGHRGPLLWCTWSPDARLLATTGKSRTAYIWDMKKYVLFHRLDGHYHDIVCCEFSPDGALLATASLDTRVIIWDPCTGDLLKSLCHMHPPPRMIFAAGANGFWVRGVAYSKNGCYIATIADDGYIRFWNMMGDEDPEAIAVGSEEMLCCHFSPSGNALAVGTSESNVSFYASPKMIPRLAHLARMAIRKLVPTQNVDKLELPNSVKHYLKYRIWE